jgi:hypothetical protein
MRVIDLNGGTEIVPEAECWKLLAESDLGRVAVVRDGRPDIFPVNYEVEGHSVLFRTNMGNKLLGSAGGYLAFEVDHVDEAARSGWSVVLHGEAVGVEAEPEPATPHSWAGRKDFLVRIDAASITGRRLASRVERERGGSVRTY